MKSGRTFYVNGSEDPWQWATMRTHLDPTLNIVTRIAECNDCGHCCELYNPKEDDPAELKQIRDEVRMQIDEWL